MLTFIEEIKRVSYMNKLYLLEWFLTLDGQKKRKLFSDKDVADEKYHELKDSIRHGWLSLTELVEGNLEEGFEEGEVLHYNDINRL